MENTPYKKELNVIKKLSFLFIFLLAINFSFFIAFKAQRCSLVFNSVAKTYCFIEKAISEKNEKICSTLSALSDPASAKCYFKVAVALNDIKICNNLPTINKILYEASIQNCYFKIVAQSKDMSICETKEVKVPEYIENKHGDLYSYCYSKYGSQGVDSKEPLEDYSLVAYPFSESPLYPIAVQNLKYECGKKMKESDLANLKDLKLLYKGNVTFPSLKDAVLSGSIGTEAYSSYVCYDYVLDTFSIPKVGKYLYLKTSRILESDIPNSDLRAIYKVQLTVDGHIKEAKELSISRFLSKIDLYRGKAIDSYILLEDGRRIIKWDMDGVYLINLEKDLKTDIYLAPKDTWLISSIHFDMGQSAKYNIKVNGDHVTIGVYNKRSTVDGYSINIDEYNNVMVNSDTWNRESDVIKSKFMETVTISVPK